MTTKIISGTITGGYTLSSAYNALSITGAGLIYGGAGAAGTGGNSGYVGGVGGAGVELPVGGMVANAGSVIGGRGGHGLLRGGAGGAGVALAASGTVANRGSIKGGGGGGGHYAGAGGAGVALAAIGTVDNYKSILGGDGSFSWYHAGAGGAGIALAAGGTVVNDGSIGGGKGSYGDGVSGKGGAGVLLTADGEITNNATISGGDGGAGGYKYGAPGGDGGVGVQLTGGGTIANSGLIEGGKGGYVAHAPGAGGAGIFLSAGGEIVNRGTIEGGYGSYNWGDGVYAGPSGAATLTNYGTIIGRLNPRTGGAIVLKNAGDRVIVKAGSTIIGDVKGGGGTLELGAGADSGSQATFSNFGICQFDAGATFAVTTYGRFRFDATIVGFAAGDSIDLTKVRVVTSAKINTHDQLLIVEGSGAVARFQLSGNYAGAKFAIGGDGAGGTDVTLVSGAPSLNAFVASMAGLRADASAAPLAPAPAERFRPTLLVPSH